MAYITLANAKRIIYSSDVKDLSFQSELYKMPIYFFSKYEENALLAIQELFQDPKKYFKETYMPFESKDSYSLVYEGKKPAYHSHPTCERLTSNYENFVIPQEIQEKGKAAVIEFRSWFKGVQHLIENNPQAFAERLRLKYGILTNPQALQVENSGCSEVGNYSIPELEQEIDALIKGAGRFYYQNEKNTIILRRFSKCTFLANKTEPIYGNHTGYSDEEVRELLLDYDEKFKKPLKAKLIQYYRLKHNPDLKMDGTFLEALGFVPCKACAQEVDLNEEFENANSMDSSCNFQDLLVEM